MPELSAQFLTLTIDKERYAIPIGRVLEVLESARVTRLPRTAPYMKGIIDLRGRAVPVVDLRLRFGMPEGVVTTETSIVVVELEGPRGAMKVGLVADAVHEVIDLDPSCIAPAPPIGAGPAADCLTGVGRKGDGFILVFDVDRIFAGEDLGVAGGKDPD